MRLLGIAFSAGRDTSICLEKDKGSREDLVLVQASRSEGGEVGPLEVFMSSNPKCRHLCILSYGTLAVVEVRRYVSYFQVKLSQTSVL